MNIPAPPLQARRGAAYGSAPGPAASSAVRSAVPWAVQPHGLLLILHPVTLEVLQAGGDASLVGATAPLPGTPVEALLPAAAIAEVRRIIDEAPEGTSRAAEIGMPGGRLLDLLVHRGPAGVMLELEHLAPSAPAVRATRLPVVQEMLARLSRAGTVAAFCQAAAREIRRVMGHDRVTVLRFEPDGSAVAVAEACGPELESFLGLHYPASDVPPQARLLYLRNTLRIIPDARYEPAEIEPAISPLTGAPPDLTLCTLRSAPPQQLAYLAKMGVRASLSLSVLRGGRLWGLIVCHHRSPRHLPVATRAVCELFAQMFSLQLEAKEQAEAFADAGRVRRLHEAIMQVMAQEEDLAGGLRRHGAQLLDLIPAGGLALLVDGRYAALGKVPREAEVRAFADWLAEMPHDGVAAFERLPDLWPPARDLAGIAAGALAVFLSREKREVIVWFRPELAETITWAGRPGRPGAGMPRGPDDRWQETLRGQSAPWAPVELEAAHSLRVALLEVVLRRLEQVAQERSRAREKQGLLLAELDHRVKNTLANIQALVRHSRNGASGLDEFVADLHSRLRAMGQAHSLLSLSRWEGAGMRALAEEQLRPYLGGDPGADRIGIEGPDIRLRPKSALALSLALHELATNAAKYGALSVAGGQVRLCWSIRGGKLMLEWVERGGPPVQPPTRRGFGTLVIERSLAYEVGGRSRLHFDPEGVVCRVEMPLRQMAESGAVLAGPASVPGLRGTRVLVVEDSALVAMELESALRDDGIDVIGPIARLDDAMAAVAARMPDAALLDIDLDGVPVFPLADRLVENGVPVIFTTGYEPRLVLPPRYATATVLAKPFRGEDATAALRKVLA